MALPSCRRCGETDAHRMVGLMTLWFGSFVELEPAHGYFYLCPRCYDEHVAGHLEDVQDTLARLHPETAALHEEPASGEPAIAAPGPVEDDGAGPGQAAEDDGPARDEKVDPAEDGDAGEADEPSS